jgi:hypothetical protein
VSDGREVLEQRLADLRSVFDAAFALPAARVEGTLRGYLGIRLNDAPYALDLEEIAALRKHVAVTPLPSEEPRLLGVAGFAGGLTAVYDLAALLGQPRTVKPVWFALARGSPVAFAFQGMEGQLRVAADTDTLEAGESEGGSDLVWRAGLVRPVIRLGVLLARLRGNKTGGRDEGAASK